LRAITRQTGVRIQTMCLSGHRKYPMGSADPQVRAQAMRMLRDAIGLAVDVGIGLVQIAGYDVFYEPSTPSSQARFLEGLGQAARWAGSAGVMLGLENVDTPLVDCMAKALYYVNQICSPWLQLMPDMGNFAAAGRHPPTEIRLGEGRLVGVHVKDTLPGVYRGVPFEEGRVPLVETFAALAEIGFWGPMTVEMWSHMDASNDSMSAVVAARELVGRLVAQVQRT
jgi:predicted hexulose-6-phosphate isomerase